MDVQERLDVILDITDSKICPHCLGRRFSDVMEGPGNRLRGERLVEKFSLHLEGPCLVCGDVFERLDEAALSVREKVDDLNLEYSSVLVGTRLPDDVLRIDEEINRRLGIKVEGIKREVNRELGKRVTSILCCAADFESPDLVITVDLRGQIRVHVQINPIFIEGRYRKLVRGIPQTKWPCRSCRGRGCSRCDYTGKMYPTSVEELISEPVLEATGGSDSKFHGSGREDVDVRMLGTGRPFVLEIKEPAIRTPDLRALEDEINRRARGMVEVADLRFSSRNRKVELKELSRKKYKVYRAIVELKGAVSDENLVKLEKLDLIRQRTPLRVSHRRADRIRKRRVLDISWKRLDDQLELIIKAEGGLYIKELISGDSGRTEPSVSSILGVPARCASLDVLEVGEAT
ncbi:tRNA pseudouridine(54/55) synthase Pus10 [Methanothermobacter sp. DP]|uniref:tRNA pseudouridine(54/55) synthase Pus10 n=1 Tax=Methanothermobacter sp. DP TaxID=2998972 RepID=UPI002AA4F7CD|nr:tRNA pseudouridine(54/55) synthase Pus10 [Methanothermobacter sp. DP]